MGSAFKARPAARDVLARAVGRCCMLPWPPCPGIPEEKSVADQASARRALAVPPRGSSDAFTTAAMSSRCSPEPSVRSRRLPGAAA